MSMVVSDNIHIIHIAPIMYSLNTISSCSMIVMHSDDHEGLHFLMKNINQEPASQCLGSINTCNEAQSHLQDN